MAKQFGADIVGIAPISRFAELPKEKNPLSIFPQAKAMIVIGKKVPRGTIRGVEQGTELGNSFVHFGFYDLEDQFLAKATYDLTIWIESNGFESVPMFAYDYNGVTQAIPVAPGKPAPNVYVDAKTAAQAAGLGEIGLNGLFLSPEFGPRQRLAMLITDMELDEFDEIQKPYLCKNCRACAEQCPLGAIDASNTSDAGLKEAGCKVAAIDKKKCLKCKNGAIQCNEGRFKTVERIAASCGRACIAALEEKGLLKNKFKNKFRQDDKLWKRNFIGEVI